MTISRNLLTIKAVAELLDVSEATVRNLINAGQLPAVRVGRSIRIRPEAVEAALQPVWQ